MKFLNLLFVLAFVFSLASCGGNTEKPADSENKTETATTTEPSATTTTEPSATTTTESSATTATETDKEKAPATK